MADITIRMSTPGLDEVARRLSPADRASMHREIAAEVQETVQDHLRAYALSHHATAARLGARPTGNLEDAKVTAESGAGGARVTVAAKGIRRALGPVVIRPRNKAALTLPVAALAYGHTVADLKRSGVAVFRPKGRNYLAYRENPKSQFSTVLYILAKRAVLKHEPGLLPDAATLAANATDAARAFLFERERIPAR